MLVARVARRHSPDVSLVAHVHGSAVSTRKSVEMGSRSNYVSLTCICHSAVHGSAREWAFGDAVTSLTAVVAVLTMTDSVRHAVRQFTVHFRLKLSFRTIIVAMFERSALATPHRVR